MAIVVGCAGSATDDGALPTTNTNGTLPADGGTSNSKKLPPPSNGGSKSDASAVTPSGDDDDSTLGDDDDTTPDSGTTPVDAGKDSGPTAPSAGDSCSTQDETYTKVCGHCGKQQAICASGRGGSLSVTDYGPCGGESGVCAAGDTQPCGKCGTQTCGNSCAWGSCQSQGTCKPGVITHENAGCPTAGTYRSKVCSDQCTFGTFSSCSAAEVIVPDVGVTSATQWTLDATAVGKRPSACRKSAYTTPGTQMPVKLTNPTATAAVVSIWNTSAGTSLDTVITTYKDTQPTTDDDYKACYTEPQDGCSQLPTGTCAVDGSGDWAGVDNVTVPANSSIWVYTMGYSVNVKGDFVLNVKTKSH